MNAPKRDFPGPLAFEVVFADYGAFVWRVLARLGVQERDLPDICQDVFLVVHRRLSDFDPSRGTLQSWLYGICVRAASNHRRRHPARKESSGTEQLEGLPTPERQHADLEERRAWERLARVLDAMAPAKREVFVLYELESLSMTEVAAILACPAQTAYSRLHAARRLVLDAFQEGEES